jgi:hypothetical protein
MVTTGSQKITVWGLGGTAMGVLRGKMCKVSGNWVVVLVLWSDVLLTIFR